MESMRAWGMAWAGEGVAFFLHCVRELRLRVCDSWCVCMVIADAESTAPSVYMKSFG